MQYADPTQKFRVQSDDTAGFHTRNCASVMPASVATEVHVSPETTTCHLLQVAGWPVWVGPGGFIAVDEEEKEEEEDGGVGVGEVVPGRVYPGARMQ